jgi:hypothetical protein
MSEGAYNLLGERMNQSATAARKPFQPTAEMIKAAENVFLAITVEQSIRPIVEGYQRKVLAERSWRTTPELLAGLQRRSNQPVADEITDIKAAWMMANDDFAIYRKRCNEERIAAKLHAETDDHCPLLVAENITRLAKHALCDAMAGITKIDGAKAVTLPAADYDKLVDLTLKLLAPFVTNPLAPQKAV